MLATVVRGLVTRKLDPSVEKSGPHGFAVRFDARRLRATLRPPRPALHVRDDRDTPLFGRETGGLLKVICPTGQAELSATDWRDGQKVHRVVEASISEIGCDDDGVMVFAGNARV